MIRTLPNSPLYKTGYGLYVALFYIFLIAPLITISLLAFNDSNFIALPWEGFSLDWFFSNTNERLGLFADTKLLTSILISLETGFLSPCSLLLLEHLLHFFLKKRDLNSKVFCTFWHLHR